MAAAADAILQTGERLTIERVRQAVGGGGNAAVMGHLAKYKELRRKGAQFAAGGIGAGSLMSDALKATLAQAIDIEIQNQRQQAQEKSHEQMEELQEACQALEADLKVATSAAFEQEADLERMAGELEQSAAALEAERREAALAREKLLGQVETLSGQNNSLQAALSATREAAIEARVKDAAQVSQIEALQSETKALREALQRATEKIPALEQEAAKAQTRLAGKEEVLAVVQEQLRVAQERGRELAAEAKRSHERAHAAEETQKQLRHKLDAAHDQKSQQGEGRQKEAWHESRDQAARHETSAKVGFSSNSQSKPHTTGGGQGDDTGPVARAGSPGYFASADTVPLPFLKSAGPSGPGVSRKSQQRAPQAFDNRGGGGTAVAHRSASLFKADAPGTPESSVGSDAQALAAMPSGFRMEHKPAVPPGGARRMTAHERERAIEKATAAPLDVNLRQQLGKATTRQEQERQKSLLVQAARLRDIDLRRGSDVAIRQPTPDKSHEDCNGPTTASTNKP